VNTTATHQRSDPERLTLPRVVLRAVCVVATFFSAFFASHGLLMAGQFLDDEILPGRIESTAGYTKTGVRLRLQNGQEVVFPDAVRYGHAEPVKLNPGDHVEKRRDTLEYRVNGVLLTDARWVVWHWLLPLRVLVPLTAYLMAGIAYVVAYRRTPFGDSTWGNDPERPRRPRTRCGMIIAVFATWLAATLFWTIIFGCFTGCLGAIGRALRG
jgi:hypothetical protein